MQYIFGPLERFNQIQLWEGSCQNREKLLNKFFLRKWSKMRCDKGQYPTVQCQYCFLKCQSCQQVELCLMQRYTPWQNGLAQVKHVLEGLTGWPRLCFSKQTRQRWLYFSLHMGLCVLPNIRPSLVTSDEIAFLMRPQCPPTS